MRTLTIRGSPVADAPEASVRDDAPWLPSQLAWKRSTAKFTLLTSIGAGTGGAHAARLRRMRSPAAFGSVTASVMPGTSAGSPFALEKPVKIGLYGLSRLTNSRKLLSGRRV
ncbi:MAG: hypothetical protein AB7P99_01285 [Vicinamibacterales bacterium]